MRQVTTIAIHCAATNPDQDIGASEIAGWHKAKGWSAIGYHWVIRRDGTVEKGRDESVPGAHVEGHNSKSIGVCLVGGIDERGNPENNFTLAQWAALRALAKELAARYPSATFLGHRDYPGVAKACPSFDARLWARQNGLGVTGPAQAARPTLKRGDRGESVRELQIALGAAGYAMTVDGDFGVRTEAALKRFQQVKRLAEDGVAGARTWAALKAG